LVAIDPTTPPLNDEACEAAANDIMSSEDVPDTPAMKKLYGDDYLDDDSMRDELLRLDTVSNAIRLSLDAKNDISTLPNITSPLDLNKNEIPSTPSKDVVANDSASSVAKRSSNAEAGSIADDKNAWITVIRSTLLVTAVLWVWMIYKMIVLRQYSLLDSEGMVQWPRQYLHERQ
jgi:hypothetical protein